MKKLLTTTALVSLLATNAFADGMMEKGLEIKFGGTADAQLGVAAQSGKYKRTTVSSIFNTSGATATLTPNHKDVAFDTEAHIFLEATGRTSQGLKYGAHLGISPTIQFNTNSARRYLSRTYIFMEDKSMGRLELGSNDGAADQMTLGAGSIAAATGGVNGDWFKYIRTAPTTGYGNFILNPAMPLENDLYNVPSAIELIPRDASQPTRVTFHDVREKSRKITYISPMYEGFQAGISYIPDVANNAARNPVINTTNTTTFQEHDAISGGISWEGRIQKDHMVKAAIFGEYGKVRRGTSALSGVPLENLGNTLTTDSIGTVPLNVRNTEAIGIGGTWHYKQFAAAASFAWLGKTDDFRETNNKDAWFLTLGLGAEFNKFYGSLTGMYSKKHENDAYAISAGVDYHWAPGLMPYAEVTYVHLDGKNRGGTNIGNGFTDTPLLSSAASGAAATALIEDSRRTTAFSGENSGKSEGVALILGTKIKF